MGLTVSYLITRVLWHAIRGSLPDIHNHEHHGEEHTHLQNLQLVCGSLWAMLSMAFLVYRFKTSSNPHSQHDGAAAGATQAQPASTQEEEENNLRERILCSLHVVSSMTFAWCLLYATEWELRLMPLGRKDGVSMRVLVSIIVSVVAFVMIFVLDKLADSSATSDHVDQVVDVSLLLLCCSLMIPLVWRCGSLQPRPAPCCSFACFCCSPAAQKTGLQRGLTNTPS